MWHGFTRPRLNEVATHQSPNRNQRTVQPFRGYRFYRISDQHFGFSSTGIPPKRPVNSRWFLESQHPLSRCEYGVRLPWLFELLLRLRGLKRNLDPVMECAACSITAVTETPQEETLRSKHPMSKISTHSFCFWRPLGFMTRVGL